MPYDFLPNLPKANLDDRTFSDLVDECLLRIPRYCPEWTNYNPSDPGITLVELFAWLTDQALMRFNEVPRLNYVTFLELLGMRLQPPNPARTEMTFYFSQSPGPDPITVPEGTEVATVRTEVEEAVVFSSDRELAIGRPALRHCLMADAAELEPQVLQDRVTTLWSQQPGGDWAGPELPIFNPLPRSGNCMYLVFEPGQPLDGAVLALTVCGAEATPTGINPSAPPRRWEAWNGETWCPVLLRESDDQTQGFSFSELARQGGNPVQGADILLHLPQSWPVTQFVTFQGRWLRCVHTEPEPLRPPYSRSPQIVGLAVRALGGTVTAHQSEAIADEELGMSDGNPGQTFQLLGVPVLDRRPEERLEVINPDGSRELWTEVPDFAASTAADRHYTLDGVTGMIQFGPLVREPMHLKTQTLVRLRSQTTGRNGAALASGLLAPEELRSERQYGAVPARGAILRMVAYRTGGGQRGNVQVGTVTILKTAVPYVTQVINHGPGRHGADAEALEQAVLRVPQMLRTRDRAVTAEDFETLTCQAASGAVARARCLEADPAYPGLVRLLVVPAPPSDRLTDQGLHPDQLGLDGGLRGQILDFLRDRKLLGVQVSLQEPTYTGVTVQTEVALEPEYQHPDRQQEILQQLRTALCKFLNPVVGGPDRTGWPFGRPVYTSDIVRVLQNMPGVRYLGAVQIYEIRPSDDGRWVRQSDPKPVIEPATQGLICSWASRHRASHTFNLMPG